MLQIPELLAPAGDAERLRYAINYGADAVYCGLPEFGMRSAPANFTPEQLTESVIYAHARGRKVYLTMNTPPHLRPPAPTVPCPAAAHLPFLPCPPRIHRPHPLVSPPKF